MTSGFYFDIWAAAYALGISVAFCLGLYWRAAWKRLKSRRPFDWERSCPELRDDGEHHHVRVL